MTRRPRIAIASDTLPLDPVIVEHWTEEGFEVRQLGARGGGGSSGNLGNEVDGIGDELDEGERFAIVAYGAAASEILSFHRRRPVPKLCAFVVYYPSSWDAPAFDAPSQCAFHAHVVEPIPAGSTFSHHVYHDAKSGFAERGNAAFEKVSANLAWSRTLGIVRKGFGIEVDLEKVWEEHLELEFATRDADKTMDTMVPEPYVNHIPTITGGIGFKDLHRFYQDFFIPSNPPSMQMRLLSRTIGVDRVVDEMFVSFEHTLEIPWMLPQIPPTGRHVEIALVSVVCIRGGKLYHEHIYWDQASVLVQLGLLDPKLGGLGSGTNGVQRLPILGAETARKVLDEGSVRSNGLIPEW